MVCSWGAFTFIIDLIPVHVLLCIATGRYSSQLYIAYAPLVASWWDYGYQTTAMANRTVIVDNNTWNITHTATVGTAMSSPEKAAWEIFNSLDVKYVPVVFGGLVGYLVII
ncbi:hypothetical protein MKX01_033710 [Papaver californicum]|nr:hypothetical protein MKX01_033710 [Papaver californicum]